MLAKPELVALQTEVAERYRGIFPIDGDAAELERASALINRSLQEFAPGASLNLGWKGDITPRIVPPGYRIIVTEDGVPGDIDLKGNGVQRALVVAVVNAVAENDAAGEAVEDDVNLGPTVLLLVEEPELYQHPTRARHFARSLTALARVDDDSPRRQVVVTTHSPYFVTISDFASVRLLRRDRTDTRVSPRRVVSQTTLATIWATLQAAKGYAPGSPAAEVARNRLISVFDVAVREGFFRRRRDPRGRRLGRGGNRSRLADARGTTLMPRASL